MLENAPFDIPGGQGSESAALDATPLRPLDWTDLSARFAAARDLRRVLPSGRANTGGLTASFGRLAVSQHTGSGQNINIAAPDVNHSASADGKPAAPNPSLPAAYSNVTGSTTTFDTEGGRDR